MDGSLRLGNGHQGLRLVLCGFVFGQVFLPDRALDLPDFLTGNKEQPGSNLDDAQSQVKVFGIGGLEFVHQELVFGESIIRLHLISLPVLLLGQGTVHLAFVFSADGHKQGAIENRLATFGIEHLHAKHVKRLVFHRSPFFGANEQVIPAPDVKDDLATIAEDAFFFQVLIGRLLAQRLLPDLVGNPFFTVGFPPRGIGQVEFFPIDTGRSPVSLSSGAFAHTFMPGRSRTMGTKHGECAFNIFVTSCVKA